MVNNRNPITIKKELPEKPKIQTPAKTPNPPIVKSNNELAEKNRTIEALNKQKQTLLAQVDKLNEKIKLQENARQQETLRVKDEIRKKNDIINILSKEKQTLITNQVKFQNESKKLKQTIAESQKARRSEQTKQQEVLQAFKQENNQQDLRIKEFQDELNQYYELMQVIWLENKRLKEAVQKPLELVLLQGAVGGSQREVEAAVAGGADVDTQNSEGKSALYIALENNDKEIARYLISMGASISQPNANNVTILQHLAEQNNLEMLQFVLEAFSESTIPIDVLQSALKAASSTEAKQSLAVPLYFQAAALGDEANIALALFTGIDKNARNANNNTALHYAAANNQAEAVKFLIKNDCSIDIENNEGLKSSQLSTDPGIEAIFQDQQHKIDQATKIQSTYRGFFARKQNYLEGFKQELHERVNKMLPELEASHDFITISHLVSAMEEKRYPDLKGMLDRLDQIAQEKQTTSTMKLS